MEQNKPILIESTTRPENPKPAIKFNGEWHPIVGDAAKYSKNLVRGAATVSLDDQGNVVFVKQANASQNGSIEQNQALPEQPQQQPKTNYLENNGVKHLVFSDLTDEDLRLALNNASTQYNVFATQTHLYHTVDGDLRWGAVIFIR